MIRPFITPDELIDYTSYDLVKNRHEATLRTDISRAELYIVRYCKRDFSDLDPANEAHSTDIETVTLATKMLAEAYAFNSALQTSIANTSDYGVSVKKEAAPDYSYEFSDGTEKLIPITSLGIEELLEPLCSTESDSSGNTVMRVTLL